MVGRVVPIDGKGGEFFKDCSPEQRRWLTAYVELASAVGASKAAKVEHMEAMAWIRDDENFAKALDEARWCIGLTLEGEFTEAAKTEKGSDRLRIEILRAMLPQKYDPSYVDPIEQDDDQQGFTSVELFDEQTDAKGA